MNKVNILALNRCVYILRRKSAISVLKGVIIYGCMYGL
jgi:hypothetical protein